MPKQFSMSWICVTTCIAIAAIGTSRVHADETEDGGGGVVPMKDWDCSMTPCGAAGNGSCPQGQGRCCCPTGSPPVWTAACFADGNCGGGSSCQMCQ